MREILDTLALIVGATDRVGELAAETADDAAGSDAGKILSAAKKLGSYVENLSVETTDEVDISTLRHKLRTPINQILGYCELMQEEAEDADGCPWESELGQIHTNARELTRLVDAIIE